MEYESTEESTMHRIGLLGFIIVFLSVSWYGLVWLYNGFKKRRGERGALDRITKRYNSLVEDRGELEFHVDWAKTRGESVAEVKGIQKQISAIDQKIKKALEEKERWEIIVHGSSHKLKGA